MNIKDIKELIDALDKSGLAYLSIKNDNGTAVELKKERLATVGANAATLQVDVKPEQPVSNDEGHFVKSPIVGIAYVSSKPGAEPFVSIGQEVKAGQVLCVVEAMKMFNEIKADRNGIISEILFEDGRLVEFDMPLFKIEVAE